MRLKGRSIKVLLGLIALLGVSGCHERVCTIEFPDGTSREDFNCTTIHGSLYCDGRTYSGFREMRCQELRRVK